MSRTPFSAARPLPSTGDMRPRSWLASAFALSLVLASACRFEHPPTPTAVSDSSAIARALSLASVPRLDSGHPGTLYIEASRIGGTFESSFEREMAPVVTFANRKSVSGQVPEYRVDIEDLTIEEDSAVAIVVESTTTGTTRVRTLLLPRAEGGWRVVSQSIVNREPSLARAPAMTTTKTSTEPAPD